MRTHSAILLAAALLAASIGSAQGISTREMRVSYLGTVSGLPKDARNVEIWIPLPSSNRHQTISNLSVDSDLPWKTLTDPVYGNSYLYTKIVRAATEEIDVKVTFDVDRRIALFDRLSNESVSQESRRRNLMPDALVTISPRIQSIAREVTSDADGTLEEARAIYDYVLSTMKYDKSTPGWGRGDTERACDIRSGNCTDFHSLFISLARARAIPARFVMGVPIPPAAQGDVNGYHCWAEFYLDGKGWVPVDISEAWKSQDPAVQNFLFGNLDFDRVELSIGRDLKLENMAGPPLNFFLRPYVEIGDKPWIETSMSVEYRNRPPQKARANRR